VNRKTIIQCVVAFVVLGGIAMIFFLTHSQDEGQIIVLGTSSNVPKLVSFTITNTSKAPFLYLILKEMADGRRIYLLAPGGKLEKEEIPGRSAKRIDCGANPGLSWKVKVIYEKKSPPSLVQQARKKLAVFASQHNWWRVVQWVRPKPKSLVAFGPEMLGNKPAPPEFK
jgi:hypothetical protein